MKTIILAAGKSTRLLPLTKEIPQPMLKIGAETILEKQIKFLKEAGLEEVVVITGYLSKKLEEFCGQLKIKTLFNPFYDVSGIAASLWIAKDEIKNGFLFLYSDALFEPETIRALLGEEGDINLAVKKNDLRAEAEKIVEEAGIIKRISKVKLEKATSEFIGIAKFSASGSEKLIEELENELRDNLGISFITVIDNLIQKGEIAKVYDIKDAQFIDIDFPDDLERAKDLKFSKQK
ncbi:MAG: phosphocholine cytidylyltransferase family protein [Candidatus Nealsonbacteria bacterium]